MEDKGNATTLTNEEQVELLKDLLKDHGASLQHDGQGFDFDNFKFEFKGTSDTNALARALGDNESCFTDPVRKVVEDLQNELLTSAPVREEVESGSTSKENLRKSKKNKKDKQKSNANEAEESTRQVTMQGIAPVEIKPLAATALIPIPLEPPPKEEKEEILVIAAAPEVETDDDTVNEEVNEDQLVTQKTEMANLDTPPRPVSVKITPLPPAEDHKTYRRVVEKPPVPLPPPRLPPPKPPQRTIPFGKPNVVLPPVDQVVKTPADFYDAPTGALPVVPPDRQSDSGVTPTQRKSFLDADLKAAKESVRSKRTAEENPPQEESMENKPEPKEPELEVKAEGDAPETPEVEVDEEKPAETEDKGEEPKAEVSSEAEPPPAETPAANPEAAGEAPADDPEKTLNPTPPPGAVAPQLPPAAPSAFPPLSPPAEAEEPQSSKWLWAALAALLAVVIGIVIWKGWDNEPAPKPTIHQATAEKVTPETLGKVIKASGDKYWGTPKCFHTEWNNSSDYKRTGPYVKCTDAVCDANGKCGPCAPIIAYVKTGTSCDDPNSNSCQQCWDNSDDCRPCWDVSECLVVTP